MCSNEIDPKKSLFCDSCRKRLNPEDVKDFGMKAEIREDGLCYFEDGRIRLTVGDSGVSNPIGYYANVSIPKSRYTMWKKAIDSDVIQ